MNREQIKQLAEEIWENHSQYIDDDLSSFETVAGKCVMDKSDFEKAIIDFHKSLIKEKEEPSSNKSTIEKPAPPPSQSIKEGNDPKPIRM